MNKNLFILIFITISILFSSNILFSSPQTPLKVKDNKILDKNNCEVILKGINFSNRNKWPPFFPPQATFDDLILIRKLTFNTVRFLISWEAVEPEKGRFNLEYLKGLKEWMKMCEKAGLLVILDMHQDMFSRFTCGNGAPKFAVINDLVGTDKCKSPWYINYFNKEVIASFDNFWKDKELQEHFFKSWELVIKETLNYPNIIGYDLFNEPYPASLPNDLFEEGVLTDFYERLIKIIRKHTKDRLVFFEPSVYVAGGLNTHIMRLDFENLVYAPHYYDPLTNVTSLGYDGDKKRIKAGFRKFLKDTQRLNTGIFLGEYGVFDYKVKGTKEYLLDVISFIQEFKVASCYWNYSREEDETSVVDKEGKERWQAELVSYPYPQRIPGILKSYSAPNKDFMDITLEVKNKEYPLEIVFYYGNKIFKIEGKYRKKVETIEKYSKILKIYFAENKEYNLKIYREKDD